MNYDTVVVPALETIRSTTLDALKKFRAAGGDVVFIGEAPVYVDAVPSDEAKKFAAECRQIPWVRGELYNALSSRKFLDIRELNGNASGNLIYQLRDDGSRRHLFISHVLKPRNYDVSSIESYYVNLKGEWTVSEYDTLAGEKRRLKVSYRNGKTVFPWVCGSDSSLLLELLPGKDEAADGFVYADKDYRKAEYPAHCAKFELSEPNVLLLDRPEYGINGGEMRPALNILKADEIIRRELGLHIRDSQMAQPWIEPLDKIRRIR